ncbi:hypothetical protein [Bacillus sp. 196mf]|uniref:hypothetical protein n=1 Tax=Bacillus sp. 196mf TaxID=1761754 RepID=UPI000D7CAB21|nr:hypothetical protein [Bacillus sp. 196mf]PYE87934.1 hypothetical protein ATL10_10589 [Bacillus sp. 196mf]
MANAYTLSITDPVTLNTDGVNDDYQSYYFQIENTYSDGSVKYYSFYMPFIIPKDENGNPIKTGSRYGNQGTIPGYADLPMGNHGFKNEQFKVIK